MYNKLLGISALPSGAPPKENDIYKVIKLRGKRFEIRYGYYEEIDRAFEPVPIYPDFLKIPLYTDSGEPFVTLMQDACVSYESNGRSNERDCGTCVYAERGDDLIGICKCPHNLERRNE